MASPNDFLDKLVLVDADIHLLNLNKIFTIRQLAECDYSFLERVTEGLNRRLESVYLKALYIVYGYEKPNAKKKRKREVDQVWGYCYIGEELYNVIKNGGDYKSPYVLFHEYMSCESAEEKNKHMWKNVYLRNVKAAAEKMGVATIPSDSDVYAYLLWRDSKTMGQFDVTASARAIPFLWGWMEGDTHGQAIMMDRINAEELNDPSLHDRYAYQIGIDLTDLCKDGAKIFIAKSRAAATKRAFEEIKLANNMERETDKDEIWFSFNPGDDYTHKAPHACIVTPDGVIPNNKMFVFNTTEVTVRDLEV